MQFGEILQRPILRRAAQRYAGHGWPVVPGAVLDGQRYSCGPVCPTVACHPALSNWAIAASVNLSVVDDWWSNAPFSVLLATGHMFDVIEVPARLGHPAVASAALGPVAVSPTGRWMFFVQPGESLRPELGAHLDIVKHGNGSWIPAPPTRTPTGRIRWEVHPATFQWRLPNPYAVQKVLVDQLRPTNPATTFTIKPAA